MPQFLGETKAVLLVENDPDERQVYEEILASMNVVCLSAANGKQAIEIWRRHSRVIDLVLLDVNMPIFNGYETYAKLLGYGCQAPIIFMTGELRLDHERLDALPGPRKEVGLLQKPFYMSALAQLFR
jgi:two-component system, cell cycle sensor histidine kinase and response regulator CckA